MSIHPGSPWSHAGSWRGAEPQRAIRAWLIASGLGGLLLAALLLAPPVSLRGDFAGADAVQNYW
jgi:hypothetical protein